MLILLNVGAEAGAALPPRLGCVVGLVRLLCP
jgi:hypothetical protein